MRAYMEGLIGEELRTPVQRRPNWIRGIEGSRVIVATKGNPRGAAVSISLVQTAVDRIYAGRTEVFNPRNRSAFLGAVLATMPEIEILDDPRRARLRQRAGNPDWVFDELILALDLYLRWRPRQPPAGHPELAALSAVLRRLPIHPPEVRGHDFRNINSVRRKLGDFTAPDPSYTGKATRGGEGVHLVWARFAEDRAGLAEAVARITAVAADEAPVLPPEEDEETCVEGRVVFRQHRHIERDPRIVRRKKESVHNGREWNSGGAQSNVLVPPALLELELARRCPLEIHAALRRRMAGSYSPRSMSRWTSPTLLGWLSSWARINVPRLTVYADDPARATVCAHRKHVFRCRARGVPSAAGPLR
jgi:hypothetical protein